MNNSLRFSGFLLLCLGCFLLVRHGNTALHPALPSDMPAQAQFMQSGYDIAHLEPTGEWIACGTDRAEQANWCRVTDAGGQVVYEGDYLPLHGQNALPLEGIHLSHADPTKLWVSGPVEAAPVPVIPLVGGEVLVPASDRDALADRWAGHPQELQNLSGQ